MEALESLLEDIGVRLANDEEGKRRFVSLARGVDIQVGKALAKYTEPEGAAGIEFIWVLKIARVLKLRSKNNF